MGTKPIHKTAVQIRKEHNKELLRKMSANEDLKKIDTEASWYPPRPRIEKDKESMKRLFENQNS